MEGLHLFQRGDGATRLDGVRGIVDDATALYATVRWEDGRTEEIEQGAPDVWAFSLRDHHAEQRARQQVEALQARAGRDDMLVLSDAEAESLVDLAADLEEGFTTGEQAAIDRGHDLWSAAGPAPEPRARVDTLPIRPDHDGEARRAA